MATFHFESTRFSGEPVFSFHLQGQGKAKAAWTSSGGKSFTGRMWSGHSIVLATTRQSPACRARKRNRNGSRVWQAPETVPLEDNKHPPKIQTAKRFSWDLASHFGLSRTSVKHCSGNWITDCMKWHLDTVMSISEKQLDTWHGSGF